MLIHRKARYRRNPSYGRRSEYHPSVFGGSLRASPPTRLAARTISCMKGRWSLSRLSLGVGQEPAHPPAPFAEWGVSGLQAFAEWGVSGLQTVHYAPCARISSSRATSCATDPASCSRTLGHSPSATCWKRSDHRDAPVRAPAFARIIRDDESVRQLLHSRPPSDPLSTCSLF